MTDAPIHPQSLNGELFRNSSGTSLEIYIEPTDVPNRPKLVRSLKVCPFHEVMQSATMLILPLQKAGAQIVSPPHIAQLILVARDSETARRLIGEWDGQQKVILDVDWAWNALRLNKLAVWDDYCLGTHNPGMSETLHQSVSIFYESA